MTFADWPPEWGVADAALLSDGIGGTVWRAALAGGGTAIVKRLSPLALRNRMDGEGYLRWRGGVGAIRLLDRRGPLLLLEDAVGLSLLEGFDTYGDDATAEIAGWALRALHAPAGLPAPSGMISLRDHLGSLFAQARSEPARAQYVEAAELAQRLLDGQRDELPLHGDFHHGNVLLSPRGWLAIDPKGVIGDPAYEAANWFYNPLGDEVTYRPERAMEVAAALSRVLDRSPESLLEWGFVHATLTAAWHIEDRTAGEADSLRVGRAVAEAARQVRS